MKAIKILIIAMFVTIGVSSLQAQGGSPPPPPPDNFNGSGNVPGGGTPIGSGIGILLALGAAYGGKKVWDFKQMKI